MKAMIFDIQRNSFVDGPGIRTTVFFKGCNLRCKWCHNPESHSSLPQMMYYKNKCNGCGKCREVCPYNLTRCDLCGKCTIYCPHDARRICGREYSVDEVFDEVIKDKIFYETSGGGVTFSGGECMLQIDFLCEILKKCKENGLHTAVDTAGNVPWESFEKILKYTDLFLYDVKLFHSIKHKQYTGVGNERILDNLTKLFKCGANVYIRIPVIGGVNDNEEEMTAIKDFLSSYSPEKTELLPYHAMGENKYDALDIECEKYSVPDDSVIESFRKLFS